MYGDSTIGDYIWLNETGGVANSASLPMSTFNEDYTERSTNSNINSSSNTYISYGFANSETKIITQYQGTGAAGNFVETNDVNGVAKKPRRVIIKRTDSTSNWFVWDSERGDTNYIAINTSDVEGTDYQITFDPNGFTDVAGSSASINASGGQYIAIVEFDTTNSNDDTYFDLPTDDTNLNVTAGKLPYTDGRDTTNGAYNVFTQSYTGSVDFSTCPDGIHYVALDSNNAPKFYEKVAIGSYEKEAADDNRLVFNTDDGKWYTTTGGELVTNGTFDSDTDWNKQSGVTISNGVANFASSGYYIYQEVQGFVVGEEYSVDVLVNQPTTSDTWLVLFNEATLSYFDDAIQIGLSSGNKNVSFIAKHSTLWVAIKTYSIPSTIDNISVYKKDSTLDTALTTPISFIDDKPYQVASGTPVYRFQTRKDRIRRSS